MTDGCNALPIMGTTAFVSGTAGGANANPDISSTVRYMDLLLIHFLSVLTKFLGF
jgi:hypothetical protein